MYTDAEPDLEPDLKIAIVGVYIHLRDNEIIISY